MPGYEFAGTRLKTGINFMEDNMDEQHTYTGKCTECGFTVTTTVLERVPHVCPHTLNKHTLRVA